jgi:hypothetical protein
MDALIVQLQLGAGRGRLRLADARLGGGGLLPFHTHLALAGASLEGRALAAGELTKGLPIGGPGPIHLLARHAPLGHQELQAPQIGPRTLDFGPCHLLIRRGLPPAPSRPVITLRRRGK